MELLQYWKIIRKNIWLTLMIALVSLSGAAFYSLSQPREYESSASLLLNPSVPSSLVPYAQTQVAADLADSYAELIRSRSFGESVVKELPFQLSANRVAGSITTRLVPNTLFFKITASMSTPERARQLVAAVVKVFLSADAKQQEASANEGGSDKNRVRTLLEDKLKNVEDQLKSYREQIAALEGKPASAERDQQLLLLRGQLITLQQDETNTLVGIAQAPSDAPHKTALVIDEAQPGKLVPSRLRTNLMLALAVSLVLGVGLGFLRDYLDYTIQSPEQLEDLVGLPTVAAIGASGGSSRPARWIGRLRKRSSTSAASDGFATQEGLSLITLEDANSPEAESFRVLRTNIQFSSLEKPIRSLVVTSSVSREGKSFVASNLAVVMAQAGKRVILVDTDLRKPRLHTQFGLSNRVGFTNLVLAGSNGVAGAVQAVRGVSNLAVITSGPLPPNPSELLDSRRAAGIIEQLSQQTEMVIFDSPPAGVVTDPIILATRVDAVLLVVRAGATRKDIVARTKQSLQKVGIAALLPVLNGIRTGGTESYYGYRRHDEEPDNVASNGYAPQENGRGGSRTAPTSLVAGPDPTAPSSQT